MNSSKLRKLKCLLDEYGISEILSDLSFLISKNVEDVEKEIDNQEDRANDYD